MTTVYITIAPGAHYRHKPFGSIYKNTAPHSILLSADDFEPHPVPPTTTLPADTATIGFALYDDPIFSRHPAFTTLRFGSKTPDVIPPFVAPEPPADAVEPTPAPDSPEVAVLRSLLGDRQHVRHEYESKLAAEREGIEDLLAELQAAQGRAEQFEKCVAAVNVEIAATMKAIKTLGGTVAEDAG